MKVDERFIRRVVADALSRLGAAGGEADARAASVSGTRVVLSEDVITESVLADRANRAETVVIGDRAILTPSAQDFLKLHNITCQREQSNRQPGQSQSTSPVARWRIITTVIELSVMEELNRISQVAWSKESVSQASQAASRAVNCLRRSAVDGVVVFSPEPARVACQANRDRCVRAAVVEDVLGIDSLHEQLGANLWAIDPSGRNHFELRNLLRAATRLGHPVVPADWQEDSCNPER